MARKRKIIVKEPERKKKVPALPIQERDYNRFKYKLEEISKSCHERNLMIFYIGVATGYRLVDYLGLTNGELKEFLDEDKFENVKKNNKNIIREKITLDNKYTLIQNIIRLEENNVLIWIADDITKDENIERKLQTMKVDSINMDQEVINKQMMVAQEIASLLGETTAETKVTLTKLKKLILEKEGNE